MLSALASVATLISPVRTHAAELISHYTFEAADEDGVIANRIDGAPAATVIGEAFFTDGPIDYNPAIASAFTFDGATYLDLTSDSPPNGATNLPAGDIFDTTFSGSVAFWLRTTQSSEAGILGVINPGAAAMFQLAINSNSAGSRTGIIFRGDDGIDKRAIHPGGTLTDGEWHHFAITWEITDGELYSTAYVDSFGVTVNHELAGPLSTFESPWALPMYLGATNNRGAPIRHLVGDVADLRIYTGALTEEEVLELYSPSSLPGFASFMEEFFELTTAQKAPGADPDNDGIPNLLEYALSGLNPTVPDTLPAFTGGSLSFTKRPYAVSSGDILYLIETSTSLGAAPESWTTVTPTVNNDTTISYTFPEGLSPNFARLRVVLSAPTP